MSYPAIVSYDWDFGDGTTSTDQNPSHQYTVGGRYVVTLTVTDADGNTASRTIFICAGKAWGDGATYSWDFGDGNSSTEQNPSHIYSYPGFYTVSLTVTNADGSFSRTYFLRVHGTGVYTKRLWDFGDGGKSSEKNPQHVYFPGTWSPKLTVYDGNSNNSITKSGLIQVSNFVITADPSKGKAPLRVKFRI